LAARSGKHPGLDQRAHAFLDEERIAPRALDQEGLHRREAAVLSEQNIEQPG
jgi:hypothetical protein